MKAVKTAILAFAALAVAFALNTALAAQDDSQVKGSGSDEQQSTPAKEASAQPPAVSAKPPKLVMPSYRPPAVGKPARSVGGGSRGPGDGYPELYALVPNHVAQTSSRQPSLFWYVDDAPPPSAKIQFTLLDEDSVGPLVESTLPTPSRAGIYRIQLSQFGLTLNSGIEYEWSVAIIVDPSERAKDIVVTGWIDRVERSDDLKARLASAGEEQAVFVYADAGLWYDALAAIDDRIEGNPGDAQLLAIRSSLLRQVGLADATVQAL